MVSSSDDCCSRPKACVIPVPKHKRKAMLQEMVRNTCLKRGFISFSPWLSFEGSADGDRSIADDKSAFPPPVAATREVQAALQSRPLVVPVGNEGI
jgi:hypothetical protein